MSLGIRTRSSLVAAAEVVAKKGTLPSCSTGSSSPHRHSFHQKTSSLLHWRVGPQSVSSLFCFFLKLTVVYKSKANCASSASSPQSCLTCTTQTTTAPSRWRSTGRWDTNTLCLSLRLIATWHKGNNALVWVGSYSPVLLCAVNRGLNVVKCLVGVFIFGNKKSSCSKQRRSSSEHCLEDNTGSCWEAKMKPLVAKPEAVCKLTSRLHLEAKMKLCGG